MSKEKVQADFRSCNLPIKFLDDNPRYLGGFIENQDDTFYSDVQKLGRDRDKEEFVIFVGENIDIRTLDKNTEKRHLLVMIQTQRNKERFLFGHDERNLFIAPFEPGSVASTIKDAFDALKPKDVKEAERKGLKVLRQGEWFFIPAPDFVQSKEDLIFKKESIQRRIIPAFRHIHLGLSASGNPHVADELIRIPERDEETGNVIDEIVYVRGKVRHQEHATLEFKVWHRVYLNLEIRHQFVAYVD